MKRILLFLLSFLLLSISFAGFNGLTEHSRANCANNESISWDWTRNWTLWTNSEHVDSRAGVHTIYTGWETTWRNAAVHWGEGTGGWTVHGWHWMLNNMNQVILLREEYVTNCSIYDGWWDKNK